MTVFGGRLRDGCMESLRVGDGLEMRNWKYLALLNRCNGLVMVASPSVEQQHWSMAQFTSNSCKSSRWTLHNPSRSPFPSYKTYINPLLPKRLVVTNHARPIPHRALLQLGHRLLQALP